MNWLICSSQQLCKISTLYVIISILQMWKPRHREVDLLAQDSLCEKRAVWLLRTCFLLHSVLPLNSSQRLKRFQLGCDSQFLTLILRLENHVFVTFVLPSPLCSEHRVNVSLAFACPVRPQGTGWAHNSRVGLWGVSATSPALSSAICILQTIVSISEDCDLMSKSVA